MGKYFEKMCNAYEDLGLKPIELENFFKNTKEFNSLFNKIYNEVKEDYNNKFNKLTFSLRGKLFNLMYNSSIVNMIMWKPFLYFSKDFDERFIVDTSSINNDTISEYLDLIIEEFITDKNQLELNDVISSIREELSWISLDFNPIIGNTINLYDKISLANRNEDYNDIIHTKLDEDNMSMVEIEDEMNRRTKNLLNILGDEDNCFQDYIRSHEGLNRDQLTQFEVIIGPKPDVKGKVFPKIINSNFLCGGLQSASDYFIDASGGQR